MPAQPKRIVLLSEFYNIPFKRFEELGVLDPAINRNTNLFIDPVLLSKSKYEIFNNNARKTYEKYFEELYDEIETFISLPPQLKKTARKTLIQKLCAKEHKGLCLGYSLTANQGNGIGPDIATKILDRSVDIFTAAKTNPAVFSLIHLLTDKVGPDYISDMTARIIFKELLIFTQDIAKILEIPVQKFRENGIIYQLPKHPFNNGYILLVPEDILNDLPIEVDLDDAFNGYTPAKNIRYNVNQDISEIFKAYKNNKKEKKDTIADYFIGKGDLIKDFVDYMKNKTSKSYNFSEDVLGINLPKRILPYLDMEKYQIDKNEQFKSIIEKLMHDFKRFIDGNNDIKRNLLWHNGKPNREVCWQGVFHSFFDRILAYNNIDLSPEAQTGIGPVDFKFSVGHNQKILVELKLSSNPNYISGLKKQLELYKRNTENVIDSYYIFIDVEKEEQKALEKIAKLEATKKELDINTKILIIRGVVTSSASVFK